MIAACDYGTRCARPHEVPLSWREIASRKTQQRNKDPSYSHSPRSPLAILAVRFALNSPTGYILRIGNVTNCPAAPQHPGSPASNDSTSPTISTRSIAQNSSFTSTTPPVAASTSRQRTICLGEMNLTGQPLNQKDQRRQSMTTVRHLKDLNAKLEVLCHPIWNVGGQHWPAVVVTTD